LIFYFFLSRNFFSAIVVLSEKFPSSILFFKLNSTSMMAKIGRKNLSYYLMIFFCYFFQGNFWGGGLVFNFDLIDDFMGNFRETSIILVLQSIFIKTKLKFPTLLLKTPWKNESIGIFPLVFWCGKIKIDLNTTFGNSKLLAETFSYL
jgi:hypothetical protein